MEQRRAGKSFAHSKHSIPLGLPASHSPQSQEQTIWTDMGDVSRNLKHGPRNDFIVGVANGQLLSKIYKYAYTKMAPIEVFEGASGGRGGRPPCPHTSSAYNLKWGRQWCRCLFILDRKLIPHRYCCSSSWGNPILKAWGSVVSNEIRTLFAKIVPQVNTHRLTESDFFILLHNFAYLA